MSRFTPTKDQYQKVLNNISTDLRSTIVVRMLSECGIAREEVVNLKRTDLDRIHPRGFWVEKAKKIKKGNKYVMRSREVPINSSLYPMLKAYLQTHDSNYLINRKRITDKPKPLTPRAINLLFESNQIEWSPHDCRHFFRSQVRYWMIQNKQIDIQVIKEMMGHVLNVSESYGGDSPFEYKLEIVDSVFR